MKHTQKHQAGAVQVIALLLISVFWMGAGPELKTPLRSITRGKAAAPEAVSSAQEDSSSKTMVFEIDSVHSSVSFKIRHVIAITKGVFTKFRGTIRVEPDFAQSSTEAVIEAASINTFNEERDRHLRGPDFFDVEKFPEIIFRSKQVGKDTIVGNLTMHGKTREVTLHYVSHGTAPGLDQKKRIGFTATTTLNRTDFDISYNQALEKGVPLLGEEVPVEIEIEGVEKEMASAQTMAGAGTP